MSSGWEGQKVELAVWAQGVDPVKHPDYVQHDKGKVVKVVELGHMRGTAIHVKLRNHPDPVVVLSREIEANEIRGLTGPLLWSNALIRKRQ